MGGEVAPLRAVIAPARRASAGGEDQMNQAEGRRRPGGRPASAGGRRRAAGLWAAAVILVCGIAPASCAGAGTRAESEEPVRICRWHGGKKAAISIRFDDSHQTHVDIAIPMLNERGLIGTFLVNPGNAGFRQNEAAWRAAVQQGHELDDHSLNHSGARTDEEAEYQIGEAAAIIRSMQPEPELLLFQRGGATQWLQRKPFEAFEAKHRLLNLDGSGAADRAHRLMSCCEEYDWFSVSAFRENLERAIADGAWAQPYFHSIGPGTLPISRESFAAVLDVIRSRAADLWCAGMSRIAQYEQERERAAVFSRALGDDAIEVWVGCETDPRLYRQPLTLEADLPPGARDAAVVDADGAAVACEIAANGEGRVVRFDVAPWEGRYEVRARGLGAAHRAARPPMRAPGPHPYLFFREEQIPDLLKKARDPVAAPMWEAISRAAQRLRDRDAKDLLEEDVRSRVSRARPLFFYYALTRDPSYAAAVASYVEQLVNDEEWHSTTSEMLITAAATCTLGLAYDWAQDALSDDLKARVRRTIIEHGIEPVVRATAEGEWWTHWSRGNWGEVIYGQVGVAALSLLSEEAEAPNWVLQSERKVWAYTQALDRDGGWGESGSYALYAWTNGLMFMDALRRVTGEDLFRSERLAGLPRWFINLLEPGGRTFIPFSNCGPWTEGLPSVLFRLAAEYGDGYAQGAALAHTRGMPWYGDIFGFLWYEPGIETKPLTDWPRAKLFPDIDWAMMRSSWDDPEGVLFALKAGQKDWDHAHHDTNSFVLYAYGRPLIVDLLYPHNVWACQTQAHNTIMVDGKDQRGRVHVAGGRESPDYRGVIGDLLEAPWYVHLVGDASMAYEQDDVRSFVREIMYLRRDAPADPPDYFVLFDDVDATHPARIDWMLHTYGQLSAKGDLIQIAQDEAAVDVTMVAPARVQYEIDSKTLEEARSPKPFDEAEDVKWVTAHAPEPVARGRFLAVLAPRRASEAPTVAVRRIQAPNLLGAAIAAGPVQDCALFALDAPEIDAEGVQAVGRSCFVRRVDGRVTAVAGHNCQRLSVDGSVLFETDGYGQAALRFSDDAVEAVLDLYDAHSIRLSVARPPGRVLVNGREAEFEYDAEAASVRISGWRMGSVRVLFE